MADKNHGFAVQMFHHYGFLTRSDPTMKNIPSNGRPDISCMKNGQGVGIEVKWGEMAFRIDEPNEDGSGWKPKQRRWAEMSESDPYNTEYWLYITMGNWKHHAHYNSDKYDVKRTWLMPRSVAEETRQLMADNDRVTIPYKPNRQTKGMEHLTATTIELWKPYELTWAGNSELIKPMWMRDESEKQFGDNSPKVRYGGFWIMNEDHPFHKKFV